MNLSRLIFTGKSLCFSISLVLLTTTAPAQTGVIAQYPFDEAHSADDISGQGLHGTVSGARAAAKDRNGRINGAFQFDGNNDAIALDVMAFNFSQPFTVSLWLRTKSLSKQTILAKGDAGTYRLSVKFPGLLRLKVRSGSQSYKATSVMKVTGAWAHVAFTWDQTHYRAYLNGIEALNFAAGAPDPSSQALIIGAQSGKPSFKGKINDLIFYDYALSNSEIRALANDYAAPTFTGTDPLSPSPETTIKVRGIAPPNSLVSLYADDCDGTFLGSGTSDLFADPGISITVLADSTTRIVARANRNGYETPCSEAHLDYVNASNVNRLGTHNLAVLLMDFGLAGDPIPPLTALEIEDAIFGYNITDAMGINVAQRWYETNAYFDEVSRGNFSFQGDVFDWVNLPLPSTSPCYVSGSDLQDYELLTGVDLTVYDRVLVITHNGCDSNSSWIQPSNITYQNGTKLQWLTRVTASSWVPNNFTGILENSTLVHELIHSLGVSHAGARECGLEAIGDDTECSVQGTMDRFDIMGQRTFSCSVNPAFTQRFGWFGADEILTVQRDGRYVIYPYLHRTDDAKVLKIPLPQPISIGQDITIDELNLSYHLPEGVDTTLGRLRDGYAIGWNVPVDIDGILIRGTQRQGDHAYKTHLIDATPNSLFDPNRDPDSLYQPDFFDAFNLTGMTFYEPLNQIEITTLGATSDGGMKVEIRFR